MEVSAKTKEKPTPVKVEYKLLDAKTIDEMRKNFGDEVVFKAAQDAITISLQAFMRRHIDKGTSAAEIQTAVNGWKPDVRSVVKASAFEKASGALSKLSAEERAALLKQLQGMPSVAPAAAKPAAPAPGR